MLVSLVYMDLETDIEEKDKLGIRGKKRNSREEPNKQNRQADRIKGLGEGRYIDREGFRVEQRDDIPGEVVLFNHQV